MMHLHPFPARMAPDIVLEGIQALPPDSTVLDPMCGSGMVLRQSALAGVRSIGCDIDPMARLISQVGSTRVRESVVWDYFDQLVAYWKQNDRSVAQLDWIDDDLETRAFVKYWFGPKQERQLRRIAKYLVGSKSLFHGSARRVVSIALSRLIITKEPKASLARDTAHSRPHRTIGKNDFDVYERLEGSIHHVLTALRSSAIKVNAKTYLKDAGVYRVLPIPPLMRS